MKTAFVVLAMVLSILVRAQGVCDSLELVSVSFTPFSDTAAQVLVNNYSNDIFSYPGFILYDQNGDTLAKEQVNLFGIGAASAHPLSFQDGVTIPSGMFQGTLELWTGFYSQLACSWSMAFELCPEDSCTAVQLNIGNFGSALINSSYDWMITDTLLNGVALGTMFLIDTIQQYDVDSVCLPPGDYLFWVNSPQQTGGQPYFGLSAGVNGFSQPLIQGGGNQSMSFTLFEACTGIAQSIPQPEVQLLKLNVVDGSLVIQAPGQERIGMVEIFDLQGRIILGRYIAENKKVLDLKRVDSGVYVIRPRDTYLGQRFYLD